MHNFRKKILFILPIDKRSKICYNRYLPEFPAVWYADGRLTNLSIGKMHKNVHKIQKIFMQFDDRATCTIMPLEVCAICHIGIKLLGLWDYSARPPNVKTVDS